MATDEPTEAERARLQAVAFGPSSTPEEAIQAQAELQALSVAVAKPAGPPPAAPAAPGGRTSPAPAEPAPETAVTARPLGSSRRAFLWSGVALVVGVILGASLAPVAIRGTAPSPTPTVSSPVTRITQPLRPSLGTGTSPGNSIAADAWFLQPAVRDDILGFAVEGVNSASARLVDSRANGVSLWLATMQPPNGSASTGYCFIGTRNSPSEASGHADAACVTKAEFDASGLAIDFMGGRATWDGFYITIKLTGEN